MNDTEGRDYRVQHCYDSLRGEYRRAANQYGKLRGEGRLSPHGDP
ncbi:MAG: hypothetical protein Q8912_13320 [Bacillota bacterium]|nr:hypothetical protein [Bacillota bacterium]